MPTYFRGRDVLITEVEFTVYGVPTGRPVRFRIAGLTNPYVVRGARHPASVVTGRIAIGSVAVGTAGWTAFGPTAAQLVLAALIVVSAAATGACIRLAPRTYQLRACYGSTDVCLFSSTDRQRFGQVQRALVRALEFHRSRGEADSWRRQIEQ